MRTFYRFFFFLTFVSFPNFLVMGMYYFEKIINIF